MALTAGAGTLQVVSEIAALKTTLWRNLVELPNSGGVFPDYPITCQYGLTTFEVDENGNKLHIISRELDDVDEFTLPFSQLYALYTLPISTVINGEPVNTVLGELLCTEVDRIIRERELGEVILAHPGDTTILSGDTAYVTIRLNPNALGARLFTIAWYKDGILIEGETSEELGVVLTSGASIHAIVTTSYGSVTSNTATVSVEVEPL